MKVFNLNNERANRLTKEIVKKELQESKSDIGNNETENNVIKDIINKSNDKAYSKLYLESLIELNVYNESVVKVDLKLGKNSKIVKAIKIIEMSKSIICNSYTENFFVAGIIKSHDYWEDEVRSYVKEKYELFSLDKMIYYFENNLDTLLKIEIEAM